MEAAPKGDSGEKVVKQSMSRERQFRSSTVALVCGWPQRRSILTLYHHVHYATSFLRQLFTTRGPYTCKLFAASETEKLTYVDNEYGEFNDYHGYPQAHRPKRYIGCPPSRPEIQLVLVSSRIH